MTPDVGLKRNKIDLNRLHPGVTKMTRTYPEILSVVRNLTLWDGFEGPPSISRTYDTPTNIPLSIVKV